MKRSPLLLALLLFLVPAVLIAYRVQEPSLPGSFLDRWSLFHIPLEFQGTFRILLLVPLGTLVVSVLRNLVGLPTFGIFMPVLMALAFRNTGLAYGLGIFAGVILVGYLVRCAVDRLHLLLVPRLSVILTVVIACFTVLALIGNQIGVRAFMAVGLLPFVILTMTVERFFIIVEEKGIGEGLLTAAGSGAVAVLSHELISNRLLQAAFFTYPELLWWLPPSRCCWADIPAIGFRSTSDSGNWGRWNERLEPAALCELGGARPQRQKRRINHAQQSASGLSPGGQQGYHQKAYGSAWHCGAVPVSFGGISRRSEKYQGAAQGKAEFCG